MAKYPISGEVASAVARFFAGGAGPSHSEITEAFRSTDALVFDPSLDTQDPIGKEKRVRAVLSECAGHPSERGTRLVVDLLARIRAVGCFSTGSGAYSGREVCESATRAFAVLGWQLSADGVLSPLVLEGIESTQLRPAIESQIDRIRNAAGDSALLIGTAKELLETTAKYVLEELGQPARNGAKFEEVMHLSRERLGILPQQVDLDVDAQQTLRETYDGLWKVARSINVLRDAQGTGHGRTSSPSTSPHLARMVVQAAALLAQFMIGVLDSTKQTPP